MKQSRLSVNEKPKKRIGRPRRPDGVDRAIAVRLPKDLLSQVDAWACAHQSESRSVAIREVLEFAFERMPKRKK